MTKDELSEKVYDPEIPQPDKDEQEFEDWFSAHKSEHCTETTKAALKHGWMAARGKK
jgi:hypothetical protein